MRITIPKIQQHCWQKASINLVCSLRCLKQDFKWHLRTEREGSSGRAHPTFLSSSPTLHRFQLYYFTSIFFVAVVIVGFLWFFFFPLPAGCWSRGWESLPEPSAKRILAAAPGSPLGEVDHGHPLVQVAALPAETHQLAQRWVLPLRRLRVLEKGAKKKNSFREAAKKQPERGRGGRKKAQQKGQECESS